MPILSDGLDCQVRRLSLYELDLIGGELPDRQFYYDFVILGGQMVKAPYVFPGTPPVQPDKPLHECQPGTREWYDWQNWQTYQAAIAHLHSWTIAYEKWHNARMDYIFRTCISEVDKLRVVTKEDSLAIEAAALCPELTMEDLERQAHLIFQGTLGWSTDPRYIVHLLGGWRGELCGNQKMGSEDYSPVNLDRGAMVEVVG